MKNITASQAIRSHARGHTAVTIDGSVHVGRFDVLRYEPGDSYAYRAALYVTPKAQRAAWLQEAAVFIWEGIALPLDVDDDGHPEVPELDWLERELGSRLPFAPEASVNRQARCAKALLTYLLTGKECSALGWKEVGGHVYRDNYGTLRVRRDDAFGSTYAITDGPDDLKAGDAVRCLIPDYNAARCFVLGKEVAS